MNLLNQLITRINAFVLLIITVVLFYACQPLKDKERICKENFQKARDLVENKQNDSVAMRAALTLINSSLQCDSIKKAAVDFKIRLLLGLGNYKEGLAFVDSLSISEFVYPYKRNLYHKNFLVRLYQSKGENFKLRLTYKDMSDDLQNYIIDKDLGPQEFEEVFLDLYTLKKRYLDSSIINHEIDSLKKRYPDKVRFFEFLQ